MDRVRITAVIDGTFYFTRSYEDNDVLKKHIEGLDEKNILKELRKSNAKELSYEKFLESYKNGKNIIYFWMDNKWSKDSAKNIIHKILTKKLGKYADLL